MLDKTAMTAMALRDHPAIRGLLETLCSAIDMGFAAVARVTERRWLAVQVLDKIAFGLRPGDELAISTTICDEVRRGGAAVIIDDVAVDAAWSRHAIPILYGFKSYASLPVHLDDGSFFGTLCVLDPEPRPLNLAATRAVLDTCARQVGHLLSPGG